MPPLAPLGPRRFRSEHGQAAVELVAAVPFVLLAAALAWQLALAGETAWLCANAARVAARAEAVGRDGRAAALSALPRPFRRGLEVSRRGGGAVRVRVRMPLLVHDWTTPVTVSASADLPRGSP
jgi:pilus assembly protein CpaE